MKKTISFKGTPVTIEDKLNIGDVFPNFRAVTKTLSEFELDDYRGKKIIVNTFPSVDTGVCALQTINFNKEVCDLSDTVVITVSKDLPFALGRFCADKEINNAITVSDYKYRDFENNNGLLVEELGLLTRSVFVLDENGVIRYKEVLEEIGEEPNYTAALDALKKL
ncbi:MAG: thiol peroxidase [Gemella haemolysans]|jgi:putative thiol peroxidase|uniref:thiol peroxidase n=1 Tax=Gemella haemolysans TaxID=1379 RepID=UPI0026EE7291|nr:thiol peroxidase [Gemella haemolysans]MBS5319305.1 thiol peroxidase [Gemella haemolysans]